MQRSESSMCWFDFATLARNRLICRSASLAMGAGLVAAFTASLDNLSTG
jgi:hypothetical protein